MTDSSGTTNSFEQARAAFTTGISHFEQGQFAAAEQAFATALRLMPGRPSVLMNLGVTKVHLEQYADAIPLLEAALAADDNQPDAWKALGLAQLECGDFGAAARSLATALEQGAGTPALQAQLAQALARQGERAAAIAAYRAALAAEPRLTQAWTELGHVLREDRQLEAAADAYREAMQRGADATQHRYFIAALTPAADGAVPDAPRDYVARLFDEYADHFDDHLVNQLGYQGHRLLVERLPADCPARFARVLDAGCGTGLIGPLIRPRADFLAGMDLSGGMVEKARARGVYDALAQADLNDFLEAENASGAAPYDLILVADVLVYIGALERTFALLTARLAPGGWLAFTVEEARDGQDVTLLPSLRYAQSRAYLQRLAAAHGLRWADAIDMALRYDQRQGIPGLCVFLQKQRH